MEDSLFKSYGRILGTEFSSITHTGIRYFHKNYGAKGLKVLGINIGLNDSEDKTARYIKKHGIDYAIAFDKESVISRKSQIMGVPTVMLIDKWGVIKYRANRIPPNFDQILSQVLK